MNQRSLLSRIAALEDRPAGRHPVRVRFMIYDADHLVVGAIASDGLAKVVRLPDEAVRSVFDRLQILLEPGASSFALYNLDDPLAD